MSCSPKYRKIIANLMKVSGRNDVEEKYKVSVSPILAYIRKSFADINITANESGAALGSIIPIPVISTVMLKL